MPGQPNSRLPTDDTAAAAAAAARARAEVIFRQHFEARFKPLEAPRDRVPTRAAERHDSDSQSEAGSSDGHDSESDWQGVSDHGESEDKLDGRQLRP